MKWGWRKILQVRPLLRRFIWHRIGDGLGTSIWFDTWDPICPLKDRISNRDIYREDALHVPVLVPMKSDVIMWKDRNDEYKPFSVREVWYAIRPREDVVPWYNVIWFPHCILKHAIHNWLVVKNRLKTQDLLRPWDVGDNIDVNSLLYPRDQVKLTHGVMDLDHVLCIDPPAALTVERAIPDSEKAKEYLRPDNCSTSIVLD
nr:hypothetical protein [Tanacetum cinerariifolium]